MDKRITVDEWLDIATEVIEQASDRFSDDGKISIGDGIYLLCVLLKGIAKAYKN